MVFRKCIVAFWPTNFGQHTKAAKTIRTPSEASWGLLGGSITDYIGISTSSIGLGQSIANVTAPHTTASGIQRT